MKSLKILVTLLFIMQTMGCTKTKVEPPSVLAGKVLQGKLTQGTEGFSGLDGYEFKTTFDDDAGFVSTTMDGVKSDSGSYRYYKTGSKTAELILRSTSGLHASEEIKITLKFTTSSEGTYDGVGTQGINGTQSGLFQLK